MFQRVGVLLVLATAVWGEEPSEFQKQAALFAQHCAKCHTVGQGNRVGPDLKGATERREREWLAGFITAPSRYLDSDEYAKKLLKDFADVRMPDLGITPEQAESLLDFVETMSEGGAGGAATWIPIAEDPPRTKVAYPDEGLGVSVPGVVALVALLGLCVLLFRLGIRTPAQIVLVVAIGTGYWSVEGRAYHHLLGNDQGYAPVQPIAFSHALHAGEMRIDCRYCHGAAEKSPVAGIPAVSTCMNCHRVVDRRKGQEEPSPEIAKVRAAWDAPDRSIEWVRVHRLPDFVFFNHQPHVRNGIQCQECHGPVETMDRLRQASDLSMGWCVNCHRHEGRTAPTHWKRSNATLDCSACHQ